jgi:hypothetical protein
MATIKTLPPTWVGVLPLLLAVYCDGASQEARDAGLAELRSMAALADLLNEAVTAIDGLLNYETGVGEGHARDAARALLAKLPKKGG